MAKPGAPEQSTNEERARAALDARLSQLRQNPAMLKSNRSLQPTPEAAKSRVTRLRRQKRMLLQNSKRASKT
jgi:hypothetical protein